ncbi:hypothetical protein MKX03_027478 [Papaver bracteatum]|nr:hypothetical protein MKX03_027478 [Papaver bracteatum]
MANSVLMSPSQSTKFIWTIENFSSLNDKETYYSDQFTVGGCAWWIQMYPKLWHGKLEMYLWPYGSSNESKSPYAEYSFAIFNQKNHKKTVTCENNFMYNFFVCRYKLHILRSPRLWSSIDDACLISMHPDKGFIVDDTCIIQVEIVVGLPIDSGIKMLENPSQKIYDENHEIVGGFSVLRRQSSLYRKIWLKYGHIASTKVLPSTSHNSLVTLVTDIMNTVLDMYRCRYIDVSAELISTWEGKIRLAKKLEFNVSWLRGRFNDVSKDYSSGRIEILRNKAEEEEGPTPFVQVKNEPVDDIQESLPGFLFEGML